MESPHKPADPKRIGDVRIPAVKGLSDDLYRLMNLSLVDITCMRRSIESAYVAIRSSEKAIAGSTELLRRARR